MVGSKNCQSIEIVLSVFENFSFSVNTEKKQIDWKEKLQRSKTNWDPWIHTLTVYEKVRELKPEKLKKRTV